MPKAAIITGKRYEARMEKNIAELIKNAADQSQQGIRFLNKNISTFYSYNQIYQNSIRYLGGMQQLGITKGSEIVMFLNNRIAFIHVFFAAMLGGCTVIPVSPPTLEENRLGTIQQLFSICQELKKPYLITDLPISQYSVSAKVIKVDEIEEKESIGVEMYGEAGDTAVIQFTSGSTSDPKGVVLSHSNIISNIYATIEAARLKEEDKLLNWLPYHHNFALICFLLTPVKMGTELVCMEAMQFLQNPLSLLRIIKQYKITFFGIANFACKLLLHCLQWNKDEAFELSSLNGIINGSEFIDYSVLEKMELLLKPYGYRHSMMMPSYGLTEGTCSVCNKERGVTIDMIEGFVTLGVPVINTSIKVIDDVKWNIKEENEVGTIAIKGPGVMQGYLVNGMLDSNSIIDGWFISDDVGFISDSKLYIKGRKRDTFIINGNNYYIKDIEKAIRDNVGLEEFCVLYKQEKSEIKLYLVHAQQELPESKINKILAMLFGIRIDRFIYKKSLPKTNNLKINYKLLHDMIS